MAKERRASSNPDKAESGGNLGFPAGAVVTLTAASYTTWEEAGESALKGGREADDPALKLVGDIEGGEDDVEHFLGAGKAERLQPSKDGEYLIIPEGSNATGLSNSCNTFHFLESACDSKAHGKLAVDKDAIDERISTLVGLKFVAGKKVIEREFDNDGGNRGKPRPTLVVEEIVAKGKGSTKSKKKDEDEDEEEEAPARGKKGKGKSDDDDAEKQAEKAVLDVLALPKYRKGLPRDRAFNAVYNLVKGEDNHKEITEFVNDDDWISDSDRPWNFDSDEQLITEA